MTSRRYRIAADAPRAAVTFVRDALARNGWTETGGLDWTLYWDVSVPDDGVFRQLRPGRRINHVRGIDVLATKDGLARTIARAARRHPPIAGLAPRSFVLPDDYHAWRAAAAWNPDLVWIRKPAALSRGQGVALVERVEDVANEPGWVVQEYLARPHLLDGYKYTLRLYVLVTSLDPLVVHLHDEGFAKLASRPFSADRAARADRFVHLTNPDVLKTDPSVDVSARNLTHRAYRARLRADGVDDARLWDRIGHLAASVVMAGRDAILERAASAGVASEGCFELLGFDVLVDAALEPWIIECNLGPSLAVEAAPATAASRDEHDVKRRVVDDLLALTGAIAGGDRPNGFRPLWPSPDRLAALPALERLSRADLVELREAGEDRSIQWRPNGVHGVPLGDRLVLFDETESALFTLDPLAAFAWLSLADGVAPGAIAKEVGGAWAAPPPTVEDDVWALVAEWTRRGWFVSAPARASAAGPPAPTPRLNWNPERVYRVRNWRVAVRYPNLVIEDWVHPTLAAMEAPEEKTIDAAFEIVTADGRAILDAGDRRVECADPRALAARVHDEIRRRAYAADGAVMAWRSTIIERDGGAVLLLAAAGPDWPRLASALDAAGCCVREHERLLFLQRPAAAVVRDADPGARPIAVRAMILLRTAPDGQTLTTPIGPAEALQRLIESDGDRVLAFDVPGVKALARWIESVAAVELRAGDPADAVARLSTFFRPSSPLAAGWRIAPETT